MSHTFLENQPQVVRSFFRVEIGPVNFVTRNGVWVCSEFKELEIPKRWGYTKRLKLRFCCLGKDYVGQHCCQTRVCGLNGCQEVHYRLLHQQVKINRVKVKMISFNKDRMSTNHQVKFLIKLLYLPLRGSLNRKIIRIIPQ